MNVTVTDDEAPEVVCIGGPAPATGVATVSPGAAIPDADIGLAMLCSLGITFPFNVLLGIGMYHQIALFMS